MFHQVSMLICFNVRRCSKNHHRKSSEGSSKTAHAVGPWTKCSCHALSLLQPKQETGSRNYSTGKHQLSATWLLLYQAKLVLKGFLEELSSKVLLLKAKVLRCPSRSLSSKVSFPLAAGDTKNFLVTDTSWSMVTWKRSPLPLDPLSYSHLVGIPSDWFMCVCVVARKTGKKKRNV